MCLHCKGIGTSGKLFFSLLLLFFLLLSSEARPVRISFLTDKGALQDTLGLLRKDGCGGESIAAFGKSVEEYNAMGLKFDTSKFPQAESGFYSFPSISQLLSIVPSRLWECPHPFDLNCFDTVIVLGSGEFRSDLGPDDQFDEFLPAGIRENGRLEYAHARTAREAFNLSNPAWYQSMTSNDIPSSLADTRIVLTAAMYCFHTLPASTDPQDVENQVMRTLRESWKKQKIIFPSGFQVVLWHVVDLPSHLFATLHAGLVYPEHNGYAYLEKKGGQGPFVRLDFQDRADLLTWLGKGYSKSDGRYFFATFNDSEIAPLQVKP